MADKIALEYGPDSGGRCKGVTIVKPLVYGNIAKHFGKKREEDGHTHQWTVYLKSYTNEDISAWIKKVHFKLHESYDNPNRIVAKPPFEVTETGWGEFEVAIRIYFVDPNERPVTIYHHLRLFQTDPANPTQMIVLKRIVAEHYEEVIFQDPSQLMNSLLNLNNTTGSGSKSAKHETDFEDKREKTIVAIGAAKNKVRLEVNSLKDKLKLAKETISKLRDAVQKAEASNLSSTGQGSSPNKNTAK